MARVRCVGLMVAAVASLLALGGVAVAGSGHKHGHGHEHGDGQKPSRIALPDGFRPEGIAAGRDKSLYVGSIPTGQVLRIDSRTGALSEAVPARPDHAAIGLKYDHFKNRLFVAGGPTGKAFVYDAATGAEFAALQLTALPGPTFINDVALSKKAAYFTDSRQPVIYAVDRKSAGGVRAINLAGFPMTPGVNNLNGIEVVKHGRYLLAVQSSEGALWRIDPATGAYVKIDLGGANVEAGDGLLLVGNRKLLVVQNRLNQIAVVKLNRDYTAGRVKGTIKSADFDVPTTVASLRGSLYLPNARFTTPPAADTDYWVTRVGFGGTKHHLGHGHR